MPGLYVLENTIQEYGWGSHTFLAELLGRPSPSPRPQAEMWMGAHPASPSRIQSGGRSVPLDRAIAEDPAGFLGRRVAEKFGGRLPFLLKVLAAEHPLSIQAHPNKVQAALGFARENRAGIPLESPERSYKDDNHKPEIMAPLQELWALHGFRPVPEAAALIRKLDVAGLEPLAGTLEREGPVSLVKELFALPADERSRLVLDATAKATARLDQAAGTWIARLGTAYPGDPGVLSPLFLNVVRVPPGRAVYLGPGQLHAYLHGAGVELMANSDNVLRGGLTPKHVDTEELLAILDTEAAPSVPIVPIAYPTGEVVFAAPAQEFRLSRIDVRPDREYQCAARANGGTPAILLVASGKAVVGASRRGELALERGQSCLVAGSVTQWSLRGQAIVYRADVP